MSKKKIQPTDAMVRDTGSWGAIMDADHRGLLRYALNHPDAPGLFADEDALRAAREQGWDEAVDWVRGDQGGPSWRTTNARLANPYRPVQELPTEDGAVIVPAEGREFIEARVAGQTYIAREAVVCQSDFGPANVLEGAWRRADDGSRAGGQVSRGFITPGTWKVEGE